MYSFPSGDKDRYSFPAELPTVHAEFTYFYFPGDFVFPRKLQTEINTANQIII